MSRATKLQVQQRVEEILRIVLEGAAAWDIREYVRQKELEEGSAWFLKPGAKSLSDSQLWRYLAAAARLIAKISRRARRKLLNRHLAMRQRLYALAVSAGDYRAALAALNSEAEMLNLFPPKRRELTTPKRKPLPYSDLSDEELEAEIEKFHTRWAAEKAAKAAAAAVAE